MLCIIDYGSGNIAAIANVYRRERVPHMIAERPEQLSEGTHFLLPGVGAFDPTMQTLERSGFRAALEAEAFGQDKPVLGICVGMHLLAGGSDEGALPGLGWIPGHVRRIDVAPLTAPPHLPHMGWNTIRPTGDHPLLDGIDVARGFYFLHSYFFDAEEPGDVLATTEYGTDLPCIVGRGRVFGAQFHPEKSHANGVRFLLNFAGMS